jgi:hypothetical protein
MRRIRIAFESQITRRILFHASLREGVMRMKIKGRMNRDKY